MERKKEKCELSPKDARKLKRLMAAKLNKTNAHYLLTLHQAESKQTDCT